MMLRIVAWLTLIVFVGFDCSCVSSTVTTRPTPEFVASQGDKATIRVAFMGDGGIIEFEEDDPGRIREDRIEGYIAQPMEVTLGKPRISRTIRDAGGRIVSVRTREREKYVVEWITAETADSLSFMSIVPQHVSVALSDVDMVSVRQTDALKTITMVALGGAILFAVTVVVAGREQDRIWGRIF
jgi:hypothetical protein